MTITSWKEALSKKNYLLITLYASITAFLTYSCMYAFRKPFTAATYDGLTLFGIKYKDALVIIQLVGYTLSKFAGIKVVSEMKSKNRGFSILVLIGIAAFSLFLFGVTPAPYNAIFLFFNGIPLGMVWGIVFSHLEGKRTTEFMGSVMAMSFIFSSGFVKSIGKWLMNSYAVSETWMPFITGMIFFIPMVIFVFLLEQTPEPNDEDIKSRTERKPMGADDRKEFIKKYWYGIVMLVAAYVMLSVIRDFRDNFTADIWKELGNNDASVFTETELPISLSILLFMSLLILIKNNVTAFRVNHIVIAFGFLMAGFSTWLFHSQLISAWWWTAISGFGLFLGYVPFNVVFFERKIAAIKSPANVGFLMYVADSFGYLGSVGILLFKNFGSSQDMSYYTFYRNAVWIVSILGFFLILGSYFYYKSKIKHDGHSSK